jgi:hypothetical protein
VTPYYQDGQSNISLYQGDSITVLRALPANSVHCWHEPAIGPVDWRGWEFLSWLVVGGQSAGDAPFDLQWARDAIAWGARSGVPIKIKQLGSHPIISRDRWHNDPAIKAIDREGGPFVDLIVTDRRGANWDEWPAEVRVRQMPEVKRV